MYKYQSLNSTVKDQDLKRIVTVVDKLNHWKIVSLLGTCFHDLSNVEVDKETLSS